MIEDELLLSGLRDNFIYSPESGRFVRIKASGGAGVGDEPKAGADGYVRIRLCGKTYKAHRLAWLWVYGLLPTHKIDHFNGIKDDNRIKNLRDVSQGVNSANLVAAQSNSRSGVLGVCRHKNMWKAQISVAGRSRYIGIYPTQQAAHEAYLAAKAKHHPEAFLSSCESRSIGLQKQE